LLLGLATQKFAHTDGLPTAADGAPDIYARLLPIDNEVIRQLFQNIDRRGHQGGLAMTVFWDFINRPFRWRVSKLR
jgi:hypothetical protein